MRIPHNESLGSDRIDGGPERKCILSGETAARDALIRLAISPEGDVLPDVLARAPGRGAWIGVSRAALEAAQTAGKGGGRLKAALARSFKGASLTIPDDLPQRIEASLVRAFTERLGLALKSGALLLGSEKIAQAARSGAVEWLAHASDASNDGSRKLDQAWRVGRGLEGSGEGGLRLPLDRAALSVALGRENVVHLALIEPVAAERVGSLLRRLLHYTKNDAAVSGTNLPDMASANII